MTTQSPARERVQSALSDVLAVVLSRTATEEQFNEWAEIVEQFHTRIRAAPPESVLFGLGQAGLLAVSGVPAPGTINEWSAPEQGAVTASVVFGERTKGHPGMAHGGSIAATFDEVMGLLWTFTAGGYVTSNLGIRFLAPVPLGKTVTFEAREDAQVDRRVSVTCTARVDEELCAEATALFVSTSPRQADVPS